MSQKENTTAVQLVKLIMSSRSVDEKLQHETIQCLKSNPGVLLSVLKSCGRNEDKESQKVIEGSSSSSVVNIQSFNQEHYRTSNQPMQHETSPQHTLDSLEKNESDEENKRAIEISTFNCSSNVSQEQTKTTDNERTMNSNKNDEEIVRAINMSTDDNYYFSNISQEQTMIHDNEITRHNDKTESHKPCKRVNDLIDNDTDDKESEPKKRKSKYSNIQGDLSHIRRDPKCGKRQLSRQRKKRKLCENDSKNKEKIKDSTETQENAKLARKLIETLKNPKSVRHQECILELLREDENLRKAFMEEKAKMGKQIVRVYRRSTSENETKHFRKEFDREIHSFIAENSQTNCQQMCSSEIYSPCSSQSSISYPEVGDTDTFINSLIASLKENESDIYQKPVQDQQVDGMLLQLNSLASNETNPQDFQSGCSETADVLYMATKQIGGLSGTVCSDSSALLFNIDQQQPTSSTAHALQFDEQQPSTSSAFVFHEGKNQASSSNAFAFQVAEQQASPIQTFDRISTDNNSSMNGPVFDASCQDQLQDLSKELYIMNNTQPKNC